MSELWIVLDIWRLPLHTTPISWLLFLVFQFFHLSTHLPVHLLIHPPTHPFTKRAMPGKKRPSQELEVVGLVDLEVPLLLSCLLCNVGIVLVTVRTYMLSYSKDQMR